MKQIFYLFLVSSSLFAVSLDELLSHAMEHSNVIKKSQTEMALAEESHKKSQSSQLGSIDLVGSYTHFNLPRTLIPLTPATMQNPDAARAVATTKDYFTTGLTYSVALFTGFAQTKQVEMDAIASELSHSKLSLTKEQLAYNIKSLYLSVLALKEMAQAQQKHVEALQKLTDTIEKEVSFGKKAQIDLLKSQNSLYETIAYLQVLKGNIAITKASLASLVAKESIQEVTPINVTPTQASYDIDSLIASASTLNRVHISDLAVNKTLKGIKKAESAYYPHVSLNSYYGYNYGYNDSSNPNSGDFANEKTWQIGLNASWSLFDFGTTDSTTQKLKITHLQATNDRDQLLLDLRKSLVEADEKIKQSYANYQSNLKQLELAKQSQSIEQARYENGLSSINDLLLATSQTHLVSAKLIESKYNYQKGKYYMDYLLEKGVTP
jgi:outer membrane protein TolC